MARLLQPNRGQQHHAQPGYVLVLTLMILTIVLVLTTQIFNSGTIYSLIAQTTADREKAKRLALGGVQIAMSQLFTSTGEQGEEQKKLLGAVVPAINRWQNYTFEQERDGVDGTLQLCIMSEQGKFNLNAFYDFSKKKFIDEDKPTGGKRKIAEELFRRIKEFVGGKDLFPAFEKLLKERGYQFNDVTELFTSAEFAPFKDIVFYEPPTGQEKKKRPIYLTDIFTVSAHSALINPWVFSDSVCALFGLARAREGEIKKRTEEIKNLQKNMKQKMDWKTDWDAFLKPLYGKDFTSLPKDIDSVLDSQFEPRTFSVLSYGKVGKISQRMLVIVEKHTNKKGSSASPFIIKRMYWI